MRHEYLHLDVFADRPFQGNQLAVFLHAAGLDSARMQHIATEMAFSETSFVLPTDSSAAHARVRIFTPAREVPMAGHPTIGTAFALAHENRIAPGTKTITLTLGTGPTPVFFDWNRRTPQFVWMQQQVPSFGGIPGNLAALAAALDIGESSVRASGLPVQEVSSGVPFLFVPVDSRAAVNRASVDRSALRLFFAENGLPELPVFVFSLEPAADDATAFSRMFAPLFGIPEDPATGGASGPLGAYLVHHGVVSPAQAVRMVSLQGVAMGRPSRIVISVAVQDGTIADVRVGGTCVLVGRGFIDLPDESDQP